MAFHLDFGTAVALVAGGAMLALAAVLVVLDFGSRLHRAFALFLFLRGLLEVSIAFTQDVADLAGRLRVYLLIAVPFAVVWFAFVYRWRFSGASRSPTHYLLGGLAILSVCLVAEGLYLADHAWYADTSRLRVVEGPLHAFAYLPALAYAGLALLMGLEGRSQTGQRRTPLLLASFGLSVEPLYYAAFRVVDAGFDAYGPDGLPTGFVVAELVTYAATLLVLVGLLSVLPADARRRFLGGWLAPLASALGVALAFASLRSVGDAVRLLQFFLGIWSLTLPMVTAYALVRHRLFDVDVKLRFAVKGTTLAGAFLAVFFVASQLAQNFLSTRGGLVVGGVVTGLVLFAINPMQQWADRVARRAVPSDGALGRLSHPERVLLYREQLEIAWGDGRLTAKERLLFARLQERLGIAAEDALRLETEILSRLSRPAPRRAATT